MNVLVDTPIWSLALRRNHVSTQPVFHELSNLIREGNTAIIGPIRQELLSGIRDQVQFERVREKLRSFSDLELSVEDYETAAELFNRCRASGVQGSNTDFLICAVAARRSMSIFTTDRDFQNFADHIPLSLHEPRREHPDR